jgi:hypothetical protein
MSADTTDETGLERAILDLLATCRELYPSQLAAALQRRDAGLPLDRARDVLDRLFAERRVARLWHRYLLPGDVEQVRATWLEKIDRHAARIDAAPADPASSRCARDLVIRWDGWSEKGRGLAAALGG